MLNDKGMKMSPAGTAYPIDRQHLGFESADPVYPCDTLWLDQHIVSEDARIAKVKARLWIDGQIIAECDWKPVADCHCGLPHCTGRVLQLSFGGVSVARAQSYGLDYLMLTHGGEIHQGTNVIDPPVTVPAC